MQADSIGKTPIFRVQGLSFLMRGAGGQLVSYIPAFLSVSQLNLTLDVLKERACKSWQAEGVADRRRMAKNLDVIAVFLGGETWSEWSHRVVLPATLLAFFWCGTLDVTSAGQ